MSQAIYNQFTSFTFTEREQAECWIFNDLQLKAIMNQQAIAAHELIQLTFDPLNPITFGLSQAALSGQLSAFKFLLDANAEAVTAILQLAQRESINS